MNKIIQALGSFAEARGILIEETPPPDTIRIPIPEIKPALRRLMQLTTETNSQLLEVLRGLLSAGIANAIAREISATARRQLEEETITFRSQREALAAYLIRRFWRNSDFKAQAVDSFGTKFNIMNADGKYTGYSIEISSLPPFEARILKIKKVSGRWASQRMFCETFQPRT